MLDERVIRFAVQHVMPSDFAIWWQVETFQAIIDLHSTGQPVDVVTVSARLASMGSKVATRPAELHKLIEQVPVASNVEFYARQVREASIRRKLHVAGVGLVQRAQDEALEPGETLARAMVELKDIRDDSPTSGARAKTLAEIMDEKDYYDWIIKGLFERGDRMLLTGPPGKGKSTLTRMIAVFAAAGIHPFQLTPINPLKVLVVDRENSEAQWRRKARVLFQQAHTLGRPSVADMRLACVPKPLDLAKDNDLGYVHSLMDEEMPDLLVIGPLYKLAPRALQTDTEAAPILAALDSLRDRGCALLIEAHAVKDKNGSLSPRGSAALEGWPEFGRGLSQDMVNPQRWELQAWRGDRDERDIPDALLRGGPVPWMAEGLSEAILQRFRNYNEPERLAF
jgi:replicative DNA helicase